MISFPSSSSIAVAVVAVVVAAVVMVVVVVVVLFKTMSTTASPRAFASGGSGGHPESLRVNPCFALISAFGRMSEGGCQVTEIFLGSRLADGWTEPSREHTANNGATCFFEHTVRNIRELTMPSFSPGICGGCRCFC